MSSKVPYLKSPTLICLFTMQLLWGTTMMIKGSLLFSIPVVKRFRSKKSSRFGPKFNGLGINRGLKLNLSIITPKGTSLRDFTSFELSRVKIHPRV